MPVLPTLAQRAAAAASDTRILDARQLQEYATKFVHSTAASISGLVKRMTSTSTQLAPRQNQDGYILVIPTQYDGINSGPPPGTVVGIILGSVAGFCLLIWLLWIASNGTGGFITSNALVEEDVSVVRTRRTSRSRSPRESRRSTAKSRTEMSSRRDRDRIIRTERIVREPRTLSPAAPRGPSRSRVRETIIVDAARSPRRVEGDDIVEVIEEHSDISIPPPRRQSRRNSYRSVQQDDRVYYD